MSYSPALLAFQQLPVGGNLHVQGQLDIHELLVLLQQPGHVLLGLLQGVLQVSKLVPGVLEGQLPTLLGVGDGGLQAGALEGRRAGEPESGLQGRGRRSTFPVRKSSRAQTSRKWRFDSFCPVFLSAANRN